MDGRLKGYRFRQMRIDALKEAAEGFTMAVERPCRDTLNAKVKSLEEVQEAVRSEINAISDDMARRVLWLEIIEGKDIFDICEAVGYEKTAVYKYRAKGYSELKKRASVNGSPLKTL